MEKITVFTPTYNRKYTLENLYNSLLKQTYKKFEWLIVDDGSTDDTNELIQRFIKEDRLEINYYYKENGGKSKAFNFALDRAKGDVFFVVDSDDFLTDCALQIVSEYFQSIKGLKGYAGVVGLKGESEEKVIGNKLSEAVVDCTAIEACNMGLIGDKAEVYYTDILKLYKLPEYKDEKFVPEEVYHFRIADDGYKLRYFPTVIYLAEYLQDGYTNQMYKLLYNNFKGYTLRCKELLTYKINWRKKYGVLGKYSYMARNKGYSYEKIARSLEYRYKINLIILCFFYSVYHRRKES